MKETKIKIGKRIRSLRKSAELTQEELGEKAGLSYKFLGEVERGQVNVSLDTLDKIAKTLNIKIDDLFSKEKISVQKVVIKEKSPLSLLSQQDQETIKKSIQILGKIFK